MADPVKVDSHLHLFQTADECLALKEDYEIWEYGSAPNVTYSAYAGTIADAVEAMDAAGIDKAVSLNLFLGQLERQVEIAKLPEGLRGTERVTAIAVIDSALVERMQAYNRWGCEVVSNHPKIVPFVSIDVTVLPGQKGAAHLRELVENHGAKGIKLHGAIQGYDMADSRLHSIFRMCEDLELPIIGHSGPDKDGAGFAEPRAFGRMMEEHPRLTVVLAHMGGGVWNQTLEIAKTYKNAYFDCCEIIEWTNAENAPSDEQLARLIREIGYERVMMGSDFPWYDLDHTVDRILELPLLSVEEKEGILGANAVRILGL